MEMAWTTNIFFFLLGLINTLHLYYRFVMIDSVDKRFEFNKRSLEIRNSENQKHERHDLPCLNSPSWTSGTS